MATAMPPLRASSSRYPRLLLMAALALALSAAGCALGPRGSDAAHVILAGDLEVEADGGWQPAANGERIAAGAQVRTGDQEARLQLTGGQLWLAPGTAAVVDGDHLELLQGDVLVQADRRIGLSWDTVDVRGLGAFRMRLGSAPRLGVYQGRATVSRPGEQALISRLRQVAFAGRRLPATQPLAYRSNDAWDSVWMDRALQFDAETQRLARGIERSYGAQPQPAAFYAQFAPETEGVLAVLGRTARHRDENGAFGPPSDALLTLFVAQASALRPLVDAVREVVSLRGEGARWGLVSVQLDVNSDRLAGVVDLGHAQQVATTGQPAGPPAPAPNGSPAQPPATPARPSPTPADSTSSDAPQQPDEDDPPPPDDPGPRDDDPPPTDLGASLETLIEGAIDPTGVRLP